MATEKRIDLIDREKLVHKMFYVEEKSGGHGWVVALEDISKAPTVDAVEVVHGRWINTEEKPHLFYRCSECGDKWSYGVMLHCKYCPNCGAKMDGDGNG